MRYFPAMLSFIDEGTGTQCPTPVYVYTPNLKALDLASVLVRGHCHMTSLVSPHCSVDPSVLCTMQIDGFLLDA
jgi:hypothetical protein